MTCFRFHSTTAENELTSFIRTSRLQRAKSMMASSARTAPVYSIVPPATHSTNFDTQSDTNFSSGETFRSLSPEDIQKMKYKIDLGKDFLCRIVVF